MFYSSSTFRYRKFASCTLALASYSLMSPYAAFAGTITAEKACAVKVEGEDFSIGQKVGVYKNDERTKPVAIISISKVDSKNPKVAVGKVVRPKLKSCAALKGMHIAIIAKGEGDGSTATTAEREKAPPKTKMPKLEIFLNSGLLLTKTDGVHAKAPAITQVPMQLINVDVGIDIYPLQFAGTSFIQRALGLGLKYRWGRSAQDIDVNTQTQVAKQQTAPSDYGVDAIFRVDYAKDLLATELRVGYFSHSLTHTLTKKVEELTESPMRNTNYKGIAVGFKQRIAPHKLVRLNLGVSYGIVSATVAPASYEGITVTSTIAKPSALFINAGTDIRLGIFRLGVGYDRAAYSGTMTSKASNEASPFTLSTSETYDSVYLGLGVLM